MHIILNVNTDFTKKLEQISRSAFPVAVRQTLNTVAFDVKKNTLQKSAELAFEKRSPNFFKANSRVEMAKGFALSSMASMVSMTSSGLKGGSNYAVDDLDAQERGGTIQKKSFIPLAAARGAKNNSKPVRPMNRLSGIKKIVDAKRAKGVNDRQKFVKSVYFAGVGGYVLGDFKGKRILWRVNSLNKTGKNSFKLTPLYSYEKNRSVHVKRTGFMQNAAEMSGKNIQDYFIEAAEKQFSKLV